MSNDSCVFALPQISEDFSCEFGELVTRRAGPDIACNSVEMCQLCDSVYTQMKAAGLPAFEYEDDLTQVPHGIWVKIQYGGLLGLQQELNGQQDKDKVDNISAVIQQAIHLYEGVEQLPYPNLVPAMQSYRIKRRRTR